MILLGNQWGYHCTFSNDFIGVLLVLSLGNKVLLVLYSKYFIINILYGEFSYNQQNDIIREEKIKK